MSEEKLCPFRKHYLAASGAHTDEFAPCVQEKCAMWRKASWSEPDPKNDMIERIVVEGFCGLAGKP